MEISAAGGRWKWEGSLKKPDATRSPSDKDPKKIGSKNLVWGFRGVVRGGYQENPTRAVEVPKKAGCHYFFAFAGDPR
jgi:hypothetical protein